MVPVLDPLSVVHGGPPGSGAADQIAATSENTLALSFTLGSRVGCVSPIDARQCIAQAGNISREPAASRLEIPVASARDAERSAPSNILRQQVFLVTPCANRWRCHYGHPPVVTSREKPQPTRTYSGWR